MLLAFSRRDRICPLLGQQPTLDRTGHLLAEKRFDLMGKIDSRGSGLFIGVTVHQARSTPGFYCSAS
jgi:hypothetical protein